MRIYSSFLSLIFLVVILISSCKNSKINVSASIDLKNGKAKISSSTPTDTEKKGRKEKKKKEQKVKKSSSSKATDKVIKTARGYIGAPYRFGGTSRAGLDCSGLTSVSYKSVDIIIPRTSQQQSTFGESASIKDLKPGDLVFFSDRKGSKKITHVGLVTDVSAKSVRFIHASTSLGVVENELLTGYYRPLFVKARRVL